MWDNAATPAIPSADDPDAVQLGVKFTADTNGVVSGIRFYKGATNTGTHVGSLWTAGGALLASATFTSESASGWQEVQFTSPAAITANTTYVAAYHAPDGNYAANLDYFASQGVDNPPLHAPVSGVSGGNGVYAYGSAGIFPALVSRDTNYWVDVVFEPAGTPPPTDEPILVITSTSNRFTEYYGEILQAEGLNAFAMADVAMVTANELREHDVVILGEMALSDAQVAMLSSWVNSGGNLIAMRPDKKLATLYSDASSATTHPAVTLRSAGSGHAAAFTYDLAKSIVYTHQGNPAWIGRDSDGVAPVRTNDLFFPDYVNLDKVAIPQADEQQRLLANLVTQINLFRRPLPRFWYLPKGAKAAIVHTLDDHAKAGVAATLDTFNKFAAASAPGCSVADWECLRPTAWVWLGAAFDDAQAASFIPQGFELGVHAGTDCANFASLATLNVVYDNSFNGFIEKYPSAPPQVTHRYHCVVWNDWLTQAKAERAHGIRYSMDYYYWPGSWVRGRPGLITGSAIPMRLADVDGSILDVYQGVSQIVNETPLAYPEAINVLIDRALGTEGYYGFFGTHDGYGTDDGRPDGAFSDAVISAALSRTVPVITAKQALTWLDGRNSSSFRSLSWNGSALNFSIAPGNGAKNLTAMLPVNSLSHALTSIARDGTPVSSTTQTIKGVQYAFLAALEGDYRAVYSGPQQGQPSNGQTIWPENAVPANVSVNDPRGAVELGVKFKSDQAGLITGIRFYKGPSNTGTHVGSVWTSTGTLLAKATFLHETTAGWQQVNFDTPVAIAANTTYVASYHTTVGKYAANNRYFSSEVVSGPLRALADSDGGNGVHRYGSGGFPDTAHDASN